MGSLNSLFQVALHLPSDGRRRSCSGNLKTCQMPQNLNPRLPSWQGHKAEYPEVLTAMMDIEDLGLHGAKHTVSIPPPSFISPEVFVKSCCKSQLQHKSVNLFFKLVIIKNKLTNFCAK